LTERQQVSSLHVRLTPIMDPHGWAQPVVAKTLLVPADWRVEGGIRWRVGTTCLSELIEERFVVTSPDGQVAFESLPAINWEWGNTELGQYEIRTRGCRVAAPLDAAGVLQQYVIPQFRRGAHVREVRHSPEAARSAHEDIARQWGVVFQIQGASLNTDAVGAILEYQQGGRVYEELLVLTVARTVKTSMLGGSHTYWTPQIYAFRAPKGQLAGYQRLMGMMTASMRVNPAWEHAVTQVVVNIGGAMIKGAADRAAIWRQAMNEIGDMRMRSWQQTQDTLNRVSVAWSRTIRGVDGYHDPVTAQNVELPTGYKDSWTNGSGDYILSTDSSFNPNVVLRGDWVRMPRLPN
jgi:hypothetical protein